jgi:hypothetical protein
MHFGYVRRRDGLCRRVFARQVCWPIVFNDHIIGTTKIEAGTLDK